MTDPHNDDADRPPMAVNSSFPDTSVRDRAGLSTDFGWIEGLPIACAVVRCSGSTIDLVAGNDEFIRLTMGPSRESRLDHGVLSSRVCAMAGSGERRLSYSWTPRKTSGEWHGVVIHCPWR